MRITYNGVVKRVRELQHVVSGQKIKVAVGGNCTTDFLLPGLKVKLAELNIVSEVVNLEYDSWMFIAQQDDLGADFLVIWLSSLGATAGGTRDYSFDLENIIKTIQYLIKKNKQIIVILPERMEICSNYYAPLCQQYYAVKNKIISMLPSEVLIVDPEIVHSSLGDENWYASRYWSLSKVVCHPDAVAALSYDVGNILAKKIKPEIKAIVVDLDNTLWGGVVGEDGSDNLLLDVNAEGRPFIQMQFFLKYLSERGIPISVVSKNNLEDAKLPFISNSQMLLTLDDFIYFFANWDHKSKNIQEISTKLKLPLDSICFIDDSVYERTEASAALPSLIVPELPDDPDDRVALLMSLGMFTVPHLSDSDIERSKYYKSDVNREEFLSNVINFDQYLSGLEMILEPILVDKTNIQRVVSLIHRTNQFNLTNRRHTLKDILEILNQPQAYAYCYKLKDKFGSLGIIGVLLAKKISEKMVIDTFLMSCRVLNRKVEYAILSHFSQWLGNNDITHIEAEYIQSEKNVLAKDFYSTLGFNLISSGDPCCRYEARKFVLPRHPIRINEELNG